MTTTINIEEVKVKITIVWQTEDIIMRAEEREIKLTEKQADEILGLLDRKHDCSIGINWDVIDFWTDYYLREDV
jgi:uncharacterized ubiquitin-like protein YukD